MKYNHAEKLILTDCDGVLMNWEYAFITWMQRKGFEQINKTDYDVGKRFGMEKSESKKYVRMFNESAAIGFLPPLRDAMYYVDLLHRKHGYVFHMITSLSNDPQAQELRIANTKKLFGETAFEKFVFLDTGADKDDELSEYENSYLPWIEDKPENAETGANMGLESLLIEHGHNMDCKEFPLFKDWKSVYQHITGD
jgi:hypothetical protein